MKSKLSRRTKTNLKFNPPIGQELTPQESAEKDNLLLNNLISILEEDNAQNFQIKFEASTDEPLDITEKTTVHSIIKTPLNPTHLPMITIEEHEREQITQDAEPVELKILDSVEIKIYRQQYAIAFRDQIIKKGFCSILDANKLIQLLSSNVSLIPEYRKFIQNKTADPDVLNMFTQVYKPNLNLSEYPDNYYTHPSRLQLFNKEAYQVLLSNDIYHRNKNDLYSSLLGTFLMENIKISPQKEKEMIKIAASDFTNLINFYMHLEQNIGKKYPLDKKTRVMENKQLILQDLNAYCQKFNSWVPENQKEFIKALQDKSRIDYYDQYQFINPQETTKIINVLKQANPILMAFRMISKKGLQKIYRNWSNDIVGLSNIINFGHIFHVKLFKATAPKIALHILFCKELYKINERKKSYRGNGVNTVDTSMIWTYATDNVDTILTFNPEGLEQYLQKHPRTKMRYDMLLDKIGKR